MILECPTGPSWRAPRPAGWASMEACAGGSARARTLHPAVTASAACILRFPSFPHLRPSRTEERAAQCSLRSVKGICVLDNDGERVLSKVCAPRAGAATPARPTHPSAPRQYYDDAYPTLKEQRVFEKSLFQKTRRSAGAAPAPRPLSLPRRLRRG